MLRRLHLRLLRLTFDPATRKGVWNLQNINLPPGESDFVSFQIQPKPNLPLGTVLGDQASITFDFNPPIQTARIENIIGTPTHNALQDQQTALRILQGTLITFQPEDTPKELLKKLHKAEKSLLKALDALTQDKPHKAAQAIHKAEKSLAQFLHKLKKEEHEDESLTDAQIQRDRNCS